MSISQAGSALAWGGLPRVPTSRDFRGDADAEAVELLSPEMFDDVLDTIVTGGRRIGGDAMGAEGEIELVLNDEHI